MERSTVIVGNGLGMAVDSTYFSLDRALEAVWENTNCLTKVHKELIIECLAQQGAGVRPQSEDDLDILHRVVVACDYLASIGGDEIHWLSEEGQRFPAAIRKYLTAVAWHFHYYRSTIKEEFLTPFANYLTESKSHLATLNYDNLLYQKLIEREILKNFDGDLVDGFSKNGFTEEYLKRKFNKDFGYYLHLHGSPLFVEKDGRIIKQRQGESEEIPTLQLVLTHVAHKQSVIDSSYLLKTYWRYLDKAIQECRLIIIFGCSGHDAHLNSFIKARAENKKIFVIEWSNSGKYGERREFWNAEMHSDVELLQLQNILDFNEWSGCSGSK